MVRGEYSEWVDVISGVPQGSVLGPILFLIYVNDIPEMVNCSIKMFADDTKLFRTVKYIDDCNILQNDLDTLSQWTNEWLLSFNVDICKVMHIGKNNPKLEYTMRTENENKILIETREEKDLGVWITVVCMGRRTSPKCTTLKYRDYDVTPYIIAHLYPQMHQGSVKDCDV